jgi:Fuc2NAc and GlcNAc transferase
MSREAELSLAMVAIVAAVWAATGVVRRRALENQVLDIPNARSSHATPTPRGGGLAVAVGYLVAVALLFSAGLLAARVAAALIGGGALIASVGYADDRHALPARTRFTVHALAAALVVALIGGLDDGSMRIFGLHGPVAGGAIAFLAIAWMTNLFNFMDGIDGIAASEAVFIASASAFIGWRHGGDPGLVIALLALAAASLGFLLWNWPPARIFMGDVGSAFLGFSLAALSIAMCARDALPIEVFVILGGVFIVDATVTLLRRLFRRDRWYEAHRSHAYQQLARRWKAHRPVTLTVILIDVAWLLPWAYAASEWVAWARWFTAVALAPLVLLALACGAGRREQ